MFKPSNSNYFYSTEVNKVALFQGDILNSKDLGLDDTNYPEYWIIITKSCDLVIGDNMMRKGNVSILPLFTIKLLSKIIEKDILETISRSRYKIVLLAVWEISKKIKTTKLINELIKNRISRFMFLPPDGSILNHPMIIDFDLNISLDCSDPSQLTDVFKSKVLELNSPFREKIAQRFSEHFSSIGLNDESIRDDEYVKKIKEYIKQN